jgi:hypothetical protein
MQKNRKYNVQHKRWEEEINKENEVNRTENTVWINDRNGTNKNKSLIYKNKGRNIFWKVRH